MTQSSLSNSGSKLVTIIILSFNRRKDLSLTLNKLEQQNYPNLEIIVVDNNSEDGTIEMLQDNFSYVDLISLSSNIGIGAYNIALKKATGDYIMLLDDDSYPEDNTIETGIETIESSQHEIVAFDILEKGKLRSLKNGSSTNFSACGVMFSRKVYQTIGGFQEELFLYMNEIEFTLRAYEKGFETFFSPAIVIHNLNSKNRINRAGYDGRKFYFDTRNIIIILIQKFQFNKVFFRIFRILIGRFLFAVRKGLITTHYEVIIYLFKNAIKIYKNRTQLSHKTQKHFGFGNFAGGFFFEENKYKLSLN